MPIYKDLKKDGEISLKELLKKHKVRQVWLANALGVKRQHIQIWIKKGRCNRAYKALIMQYFDAVEKNPEVKKDFTFFKK